MSTGKLIIYHGGCWDGFCAAWLLRRKFPDAVFLAAQYGDEPPIDGDVVDRDVYIVDFSYPRDVLERIYAVSASLIVLDHHKTARKDLDGLPYCVFDMDKSGARLTHEYIDRAIDGVTAGRGTIPHWLVSYTEDRDLWLWECDCSREINAWLRSHPLDFDLWDEFGRVEHGDDEFNRFIAEGEAILRAERNTVQAKVRQSHEVTVPMPADFDGEWWTTWRAANATTLISETASALAEVTGVGCCWFEMPDGSRVYSLRALSESNVDVSDMARAFGGGGHAKAAGFKLCEHPWVATQ